MHSMQVLFYVLLAAWLLNVSAAAWNPNTSPCYKTTPKACLQLMSIDQKIGQMTEIENLVFRDQPVADIAKYHLGSVISGGGGGPNGLDKPGSATEWANMVDNFQTAALKMPLKIPLLYGIDSVHGHSNVYGATVFPHNIGLGAAGDAGLVRRISEAAARESLATGCVWNFAPCVSVSRDDRWGRVFESFSENTTLTTILSRQAVIGFQGGSAGVVPGKGMLASVKHFLGDGGTKYGTGDNGYAIDQGNLIASEALVRKLHLPPYQATLAAKAGSVMVSYSSINGVKMLASSYWITKVLKGELGFTGIVTSDWEAVDQIDPGNYAKSVRIAINAGADMIMVPYNYKKFIQTLKAEVAAGRVKMSRIDDAVLRILRAKYALKLWDAPFANRTLLPTVGSAAHRKIAREAVGKSMVLLKKAAKDKTGSAAKYFPLPKTGKYSIMVAGKSAKNIGNQCGGWTIAWQGKSGAVTKGTTVLAGVKTAVSANKNITVSYSVDGSGTWSADIGVAVIGELPYAEGLGDRAAIALDSKDKNVINTLCGRVKKACIVVLISGRPLIITDYLAKAQVWIAGWLPGSEGAGVADVLFGARPFTGKLPFTWPRSVKDEPTNKDDGTDGNALFKLGFGLR